MSDPKDDSSHVADITRAVAEVAKAVPIYQDAVQPGAKEIGKSLQTVGRTFNAMLAPIRGMVWSIEQLEDFLANKVETKLKNTPQEHIQTPKASVVVPALDSVRVRADEPEVQELYANLIASAMDSRMSRRIFPSFVEILKQLTPDEAKILQYINTSPASFPVIHIMKETIENGRMTGEIRVVGNLSFVSNDAGCEYPALVQPYLDNLHRLGLIKLFEDSTSYIIESVYERLEKEPVFIKMRDEHNVEGKSRGAFKRSGFSVTTLGRDFLQACVKPYEQKSEHVLDD